MKLNTALSLESDGRQQLVDNKAERLLGESPQVESVIKKYIYTGK